MATGQELYFWLKFVKQAVVQLCSNIKDDGSNNTIVLMELVCDDQTGLFNRITSEHDKTNCRAAYYRQYIWLTVENPSKWRRK